MTLAERLAEYVRAAFTGIWVQSLRARRRARRDRRPLPRPGLVPGHLGHRPGPGPGRPVRPRPAPSPAPPTRWPRSGRWAPWPRPTARRCWCSRNFHRFLGIRRGRPGPRHARSPPASRPAPSSSSWPRSCRSPSSWRSSSSSSSTTCPAATSSEPIARAIATEPGELPEGDGLDGRARRGGRADPVRGRERLQPLAGPPRPARRRASSGSSRRGMLKKSGLLTLHRGGETFADLGGLEALKAFCTRALRPGRPRAASAPGASSCSGRRARARAPSARRSGNETGRPTLVLDVGALIGLARRPDRGERPPGAAARRRDGALRGHDRRGREGPRRRRLRRPDRLRASRPGCSARC